MTQKIEKEKEDVGELFLVQLNKEDLKKLGFVSNAIERMLGVHYANIRGTKG